MASEDALRWRCRRGTREMDLMLMRYLDTRYAQASAEEQAAFARLLELPDPELAALLYGQTTTSEQAVQGTVDTIRALTPT